MTNNLRIAKELESRKALDRAIKKAHYQVLFFNHLIKFNWPQIFLGAFLGWSASLVVFLLGYLLGR